jgi:hypothetical protein
MNVIHVLGDQGPSGHHASLYANTVIEPVGTTRLCKDEDMLTVTFLGAVGGEGNDSETVPLPDGLVFQMPAGQALMVNTHYLNTTTSTLVGESVVDVLFAEPSDDLVVAGSFALNYSGFEIPPNSEYTVDVTCTVEQPLSLVLYSNHMHRFGETVFTEVQRTDGSVELLSRDEGWSQHDAFAPPFVSWTKDAPMVIQPGDILHEQCTWVNDTSDTVLFPTEMCVGVGYTLEGGSQYICSASPM